MICSLSLLLLLGSGCQNTKPTEEVARAASTPADVKINSNPKKSGRLVVALKARPTNPRYSGTFPGTTHPLFLNFLDERDPKDIIGKNTEDEGKTVLIMCAAEGIGPLDFVREQLSQDLHDNGASLVSEPALAGRRITLRLLRFWAEESPGYRADVRAAIEVKDSSGAVLWNGTAAGGNSRFGRSLKPDNYNECLTDSTIEMLGKLLGNSDFQKAIAR